MVTGGAGFIGSNLVDGLLARGDRVAVIDNLSSGKRANLEGALALGAELHEADVRDAGAISDIFAAVRPQLVFHLAAQIDVRRSVEDPALDAKSNVLGTIAVLEAALATGSKRIVFSSTGGGLYGDAELIPTPEDYPIRPLAPYGQGKHAAEGYCELYARLHGLSTVSLRYGNVYGPRQDVHGEAGVVAIFCGALIEGRTPTVFGDGRQTRDWVEVGDVVRANLIAADRDITGPVNIGHGQETSVLDLLRGAERGRRRPQASRAAICSRAPGRGPAQLPLDVTRAAEQLGWKAQTALKMAAKDPVDAMTRSEPPADG